MKTEEINYRWKNLIRDTKLLADWIKESKYNFEILVAITRGGLFVSGMLSQYLDIKAIETISIHSYNNKKRHKMVLFKGIDKKLPCNKKTLICDDVIDTGETMNITKRLFPNSKIAVLHYKLKNKPIIKPDYYCQNTDKWIVYPWEVNEK